MSSIRINYSYALFQFEDELQRALGSQLHHRVVSIEILRNSNFKVHDFQTNNNKFRQKTEDILAF